MKLRNFLKNLMPLSILNIIRKFNIDMTKFFFDRSKSVKEDINRKYHFDGDLVDLFVNNSKYNINKWHHYIPIYDRYFSKYRNQKVRILEIGVSKGGSLQMWRNYFGEEAIIYGIDIDVDCSKFNGIFAQVRIGSQIDEIFLDSVISEMGGVDIILDDGSHLMEHIYKSLTFLFPKLSDTGIYLIEDLHTSYWGAFGGGYSSKKNFFRILGVIIHDMHHWYHRKKTSHRSIVDKCSGIHIHDSIVVLERGPVFPPVQSEIG